MAGNRVIARRGLWCFLWFWSATLFGKITKDVRHGLKHLPQYPSANFADEPKLPANYLLPLRGSPEYHAQSKGHDEDYQKVTA